MLESKQLCEEMRGCLWREAEKGESNGECEPDQAFVASQLLRRLSDELPPICDIYRVYIETTASCVGHTDEKSCMENKRCWWDPSGNTTDAQLLEGESAFVGNLQ